jgi:hypothetical protein
MISSGLETTTFRLVAKDGNYSYGKLSVFWKIKITSEMLSEQTVETEGNYLYGKLSVFWKL